MMGNPEMPNPFEGIDAENEANEVGEANEALKNVKNTKTLASEVDKVDTISARLVFRQDLFNELKMYSREFPDEIPANNVLKSYGINKDIHNLTKGDLSRFSSEEKYNIANSLAMVYMIEFKGTPKYLTPGEKENGLSMENKYRLNKITKNIYFLLESNIDNPVLPTINTLAVGDGGGTTGIAGLTNYGKEFFNYDQNDKSINTQIFEWTSNEMFLDFKVSGVDGNGPKDGGGGANVFLSIGDKILKGHTEGKGSPKIIRENRSDFESIKGVSIVGTRISLDRSQLDAAIFGKNPRVGLKVVSNTLLEQNGEKKFLDERKKYENKDEVLVQVVSNGLMMPSNSVANIPHESGLDFFEFGKYDISEQGQKELNNIWRITNHYNDHIVDFNAIESFPISINAGVDYVPPTGDVDYKTPREALKTELWRIMRINGLNGDLITNLVRDIEEKTKNWDNGESDAKNKQSDLVICRSLSAVKYILNKILAKDENNNTFISKDLLSKIVFSAGEFKKGTKPINNNNLDVSGKGVQKDRFFYCEFDGPVMKNNS